MVRFLALVTVVLFGCWQPAFAISSALCDDDGVTEIPAWAQGRDADQCLLVDPGNGDPIVKFQYETFHKDGVDKRATVGKSGTLKAGKTVIDYYADAFGKCSTKPPAGSGNTDTSGLCNYVIWDTIFDNYYFSDASGEDTFKGMFYVGTQNFLIKDSKFYNTWRCGCDPDRGDVCDEGSWSGPNGLACLEGDPGSGAHSDGWQSQDSPNGGGWVVVQDSEFLNVGHQSMLLQSGVEVPPAGSIMIQGYKLGQYGTTANPVAVGEDATTWIDDCHARNTYGGSTGSGDFCLPGNISNAATFGYPFKEVWLVDWTGNLGAGFWGSNVHDKVVVVNTGCDSNSCGGVIGYNNGWPHPIVNPAGVSGPGVCPNGEISPPPSDKIAQFFCYTSLDLAKLSHKLPPFAQHSASGWLDGDEDGIPNFLDRCSLDSRNVLMACDTDQDGYGNVCDGDFNQNNAVTSIDYTMFFAPDLQTGVDSGRGTDMNCGGSVTAIDYTMFFVPQLDKGSPGPSGLACAGSSPCP